MKDRIVVNAGSTFSGEFEDRKLAKPTVVRVVDREFGIVEDASGRRGVIKGNRGKHVADLPYPDNFNPIDP